MVAIDDHVAAGIRAERLNSLPEIVMDFHLEIAAPGRLVFRYRPSALASPVFWRRLQHSGLTVLDLATEERPAGHLPAVGGSAAAGRAPT